MTDSAALRPGDAYDVVAATYAQVLPDTTVEDPLDLALVDAFHRSLPGPDVLDAGCGAGRMLRYLGRLDGGLRLQGVDVSRAMVELASAAAPTAPVRVGDLADLPYADDSFHGVLAWYSIIHTSRDDLPVVAAQLRRVLRPGGCALLGFQVGVGVRRLERAYGHDVTLEAALHQVDDVAATLADAGLTTTARLERAPRTNERHSQGFVLARRTAP